MRQFLHRIYHIRYTFGESNLNGKRNYVNDCRDKSQAWSKTASTRQTNGRFSYITESCNELHRLIQNSGCKTNIKKDGEMGQRIEGWTE